LVLQTQRKRRKKPPAYSLLVLMPATKITGNPARGYPLARSDGGRVIGPQTMRPPPLAIPPAAQGPTKDSLCMSTSPAAPVTLRVEGIEHVQLPPPGNDAVEMSSGRIRARIEIVSHLDSLIAPLEKTPSPAAEVVNHRDRAGRCPGWPSGDSGVRHYPLERRTATQTARACRASAAHGGSGFP